MAVNCCVVPWATVGLRGVTASETSCGLPTVSEVEPATELAVAVIVAVPIPALVARPCVPLLLLTTATMLELELQVAAVVTSCVLPSVKVPVAVNCCVVPRGIEGLGGAMAIDTSMAGVTVSVPEPLIEPEVAVIVVVPVAALVARAMVGAESLMVATFTAEDVQ